VTRSVVVQPPQLLLLLLLRGTRHEFLSAAAVVAAIKDFTPSLILSRFVLRPIHTARHHSVP